MSALWLDQCLVFPFTSTQASSSFPGEECFRFDGMPKLGGACAFREGSSSSAGPMRGMRLVVTDHLGITATGETVVLAGSERNDAADDKSTRVVGVLADVARDVVLLTSGEFDVRPEDT